MSSFMSCIVLGGGLEWFVLGGGLEWFALEYFHDLPHVAGLFVVESYVDE